MCASQFLNTNLKINVTVVTEIYSATMFIFPFENFNTNKLFSSVFNVTKSLGKISLSLSLKLTF